MPLISIIIPIYNVEKYLDRCINSVINQTLTDIEIILINDGSTDKSLEICNKYAERDERIILINQNNLGASVARNKRLDIAKGYWIGFIDRDDYIEHNMYEILYDNAIKNNVDICASFFA